MKNKYASKKLIVFDLDGTLAPSKFVTDQEMIGLILQLLEKKKMAVIGGGGYGQFQTQLLNLLPRRDKRLRDLFIFPTNSNIFYRYGTSWKKIYAHKLSAAEKLSIRTALRTVLKDIHYIPPKKIYGVTLEDRATQMSFSPVGQDVVAVLGKKGIRVKEEWKKKNDPLRFKIAKLLAKKLPKLEVRVGGLTTIDITRKGIDKAYGVRQINKILHIPIKDMLFIGDALYPGGNDAAARKTGIECVSVRDPEDTKLIIQKIIAE
jgi:phosphomannomutase